MTTPAVALLRENFPSAFISYIVEKPYSALVTGNPAIDRVIALEKKQNLKYFLGEIREIRKEKYDVVLDFHGGPRASLLTFFSKAKLKIGYKVKYKNFIYDIKIPRKPKNGSIHSVENHVNLVKALGINSTKIPPLSLPFPLKPEVENVKKIIEDNKLESSRMIVLHISAGNRFRDFGVDKIAKLINLLAKSPGTKILLVGSQEDQKAAEEIQKKCDFAVLSLVGKLNLMELKELISRSALFVGPDSGPMHIAASTSTPIVAYFGPTLPVHFSPWKARFVVIEKKLACRPCKQKRCLSEDFCCLQTITPEEIFEACLSFI